MEAADQLRARFAARLRELAERKRMPLTVLAEKAGTARSYMWAVLGGKKSPTLDWIARIAEVLGIDPVELIRPPRKPRAAQPKTDGG